MNNFDDIDFDDMGFDGASIAHALQLCDSLPVHWVASQSQLDTLVDTIDTLDVVALDSEFIKRNTFYPILALVQVNTGEEIYLIDAPKLDLSEFWQALIEIPKMIWYACGEDLAIFYGLTQCPPLDNVFDVQIGVAYLTGDLQAGYAKALSQFLGLSLDKSESQSDWLMRPLTDSQMRYAAADVRYLLVLDGVVKHKLAQKLLMNYVIEDCQSYAKELYRREHMPSDQWYLEHALPKYTPAQLAVLQQVVIWRDELARSINCPRSHILNKQALREVIESLPKNLKELGQTTIRRSAIRQYGNQLLAVIDTAKNSHQKLPTPKPFCALKDKSLKDKLDRLLAQYSQQSGIPAVVLLKTRWIIDLMCLIISEQISDKTINKELLPIELQGYRYLWLTKDVLPVLLAHKECTQKDSINPSLVKKSLV